MRSIVAIGYRGNHLTPSIQFGVGDYGGSRFVFTEMPMRILVVDDVGFVRHTLERLLSSHGHSVVTADSGAAALGALQKDLGIEAILTDLLMPGMDGVELFHQAQQLDRLGDAGPLPPPALHSHDGTQAGCERPHQRNGAAEKGRRRGVR